MKKLSELKKDEKGVIANINGDARFVSRITSIGLTPGCSITVILNELLIANVAKPEALAFIFAITFNMPCIVALAATYQETHSAKWTTLIALYYTFGALILACVAYHIGLLIW